MVLGEHCFYSEMKETEAKDRDEWRRKIKEENAEGNNQKQN